MTNPHDTFSEGRNRYELPLSALDFQIRVNAAMQGKPRFGGPASGSVLHESELNELQAAYQSGTRTPEDFANTVVSMRQIKAIKQIDHYVEKARASWLARNEPGISDTVRQARITAAKFFAAKAREINAKRKG